jgi:TusA-related sulfurtransferase
MVKVTLDTRGMGCPKPILETAIKAREMRPVNILVVLADCHSFSRNVTVWCERTGGELSIQGHEGEVRAEIRF